MTASGAVSGRLPLRGGWRALRAVWDEPRPEPVPRRGRPDLALAVAFVVLAVVEVVLRAGLPGRFAGLAAVLVSAVVLPWRRERPLAVALVAVAAGSVALLATGGEALQLFSFAVLLTVPYALARLGSGRDAVLGASAMAGQTVLAAALRHNGIGDLVGGLGVLFAVLALGLSLRYRAASRRRSLEEVRLRERERLARDLHDTVAHHVSAIAIRAQAGLAVADGNPAAAADALRVIETEASRTLVEMRALVRVLRDGEPASLAPGPALTDVAGLADAGAGVGTGTVAGQAVPVEVSIDGDPSAVSPPVGAAVYRIAQEAVTNARRHARGASRVDVRVAVGADRVRLSVRDDGEPGASDSGHGHGLAGMVERAQLLGGRCVAGPADGRGWSVEADLPRTLAS